MVASWLQILALAAGVGIIIGIYLGAYLDEMYEAVDEKNANDERKLQEQMTMEKIVEPQEEIKEQMDAYDMHLKVWHNNAGDPIVVLHPDFPITYARIFPDMIENWDKEGHPNLDKLCYFMFVEAAKAQICSRNMVGTLHLFYDENEDRRLTDGEEIFWSLEIDSYSIASKHDTNNNGQLDQYDDSWNQIYLTDFLNLYKPSRFDYVAFPLIPDEVFADDCFGPGIYANPATYEQDEAYVKCLKSGKLDQIKFVLEDDIRIKAYIKQGAIMKNGSSHMTIAAVQGYWEEK